MRQVYGLAVLALFLVLCEGWSPPGTGCAGALRGQAAARKWACEASLLKRSRKEGSHPWEWPLGLRRLRGQPASLLMAAEDAEDEELPWDGPEGPVFHAGDKVEVLVKTVDLSKQALDAGLDANDLVGTVAETWGEEEGMGVTVQFFKEGEPDKVAFESFFMPDELELWVEPSEAEAQKDQAKEASAGMYIVADLLILPVGGLPKGLSLSACSSKAVQTLAAYDGIQIQAHASGITLIGDWDSVMPAVKACNQALLDAGCSDTHMTIKVTTSAG